jgi:hypothetical protein
MESLISTIAFGTSVIGCTIWKKKHSSNIEHSNDLKSMKETRYPYSSSASPSSSHLIRHLSTSSKWSDYNEEEEFFIQDFPKVELHVVRKFLFASVIFERCFFLKDAEIF